MVREATAAASTTADGTAGPAITVDEIAQAFAGRIRRVPLTFGYRFGLLLVTLVTLLLPLLYLGVLALIAWGVLLHAQYNTWILEGGGLGWLRAIAYLSPVVGGAIAVFFMFKPLLARSTAEASDLELDERTHPLLFALVRGICQVVGAPMPKKVSVDCRVNASASLRRGFLSFFGHDLQLTIGLPLIVDLPLRHLTGILAHEMGHFAQGSGMRLTYLVRSINAWLFRVVYQRDRWDAKLDEWERLDSRLFIMIWTARAGIWLSRLILKGLLNAGHAVSTLMLRHMEYDADRYEARVIGSDQFSLTAFRIRVLGVAAGRAMATLAAAYSERRLTENFPALVVMTASRIPPEVVLEIEKSTGDGTKAGVFDTHPPDASRIESVRRENAPGIFHLSGAASALLPDLPELCAQATVLYYQREHGIDVREVSLISASALSAHDKSLQDSEAAASRYFGPLVSPARPLLIEPLLPPPPAQMEETLETVAECKMVLERLREETNRAAEKMLKAHETTLAARAAGAILAAGFRIDRQTMGDFPDETAARAAEKQARAERKAAEDSLAPARAALRERLTSTLSLLGRPEILAQMSEGGAAAQNVTALLGALAALANQATLISEMMEDMSTAAAVLSIDATGDEEVQRRFNHAFSLLQSLHLRLGKLLAPLGPVPYPFQHARGTVSLAVYLSDGMPPYENDLSAFSRTGHVLGGLYAFHRRVLGRIAETAEEIERVTGAITPRT